MNKEFKLDKTAFASYKLGQEPKSYEYWLTQPIEDRIEAIEFLRNQYMLEHDIKPGLQRVYRVIEFSQS